MVAEVVTGIWSSISWACPLRVAAGSPAQTAGLQVRLQGWLRTHGSGRARDDVSRASASRPTTEVRLVQHDRNPPTPPVA